MYFEKENIYTLDSKGTRSCRNSTRRTSLPKSGRRTRGRYRSIIYTGLQGGSIMKGWMKEEKTMITCCSDGTRPVIFKIERIDYE